MRKEYRNIRTLINSQPGFIYAKMGIMITNFRKQHSNKMFLDKRTSIIARGQGVER